MNKAPNLARKAVPPAENGVVPDGKTILTRDEFAKRVGISPWTLRYYDKNRIFPCYAKGKGGRGNCDLYHISQVEDFRSIDVPTQPHQLKHSALYTGEQAQRAFKAYDEGKGPRQVVIDMALHPHVAEALLYTYNALEQGAVVNRQMLHRVNALTNLDGIFPVKTGEDLVDMLEKASARIAALEDRLSDQIACSSCKRTEANYCKGCVSTTVDAVMKEGFEKGFSTALDKVREAASGPQNTTGASAGGAAETPEGTSSRECKTSGSEATSASPEAPSRSPAAKPAGAATGSPRAGSNGRGRSTRSA